MKDLTQSLLKKVKESVSLRNSHSEDYIAAFRQAERFITATINGQLEFVPLQLLFIYNNKYQILMEIEAVFGVGIEHAQLDDLLIKFYNDHDLKRDIDSIANSVKYHIKPKTGWQDGDTGPIHWDKIEELSKYSGQPYKASDENLKKVGQEFATYLMYPTNEWGEAIVPKNYVLERERYWQVAGHFKSFTWAKIKHKNHADKQLFFSVGIDIGGGKLIFKLDCLRSGTHKLSNYDIRKFDYYTENLHCVSEIGSDLGRHINWQTMQDLSKAFIKDYESVYLGVIDYIWGGKIDISLFKDKLFNILPENAKFSQSKPGEPLPEILYNRVLDGVVRYEQYMLTHANKEDLAALVKFTFDKITQIDSFEFDGQHKRIYVVASTGGPTTPFEISEALNQLLATNEHAYLYQIYDYHEGSNCGKLVIHKGDPKTYAKLDSKVYLATIK